MTEKGPYSQGAPCGPECNGTWPAAPGESPRAFHVKGCPNDPALRPHLKFEEFKQRALQNPETRRAYEEAMARPASRWDRLTTRWYDRKPLRCRLFGHAWGPDYPMLDGTPARKCSRGCGWHQIPSQSNAAKGSCLCGCHSGAQMVCLCRAEDGEVCAADKGSTDPGMEQL